MINLFLSKTEPNFQAIISRSEDFTPLVLEQFDKIESGCYELTEMIAMQWVEKHPYSLDSTIGAVYDDFILKVQDNFEQLFVSNPDSGRLIEPLIEYTRQFYKKEFEDSQTSIPVISHRQVHILNARIECLRMIACWCGRIRRVFSK